MPDPKTFSRDQVIRILLYRIQKLEKVQDAAQAIREDGLVGRGKEVNGAQTVQVNHKHWIDLLDATTAAKIEEL